MRRWKRRWMRRVKTLKVMTTCQVCSQLPRTKKNCGGENAEHDTDDAAQDKMEERVKRNRYEAKERQT